MKPKALYHWSRESLDMFLNNSPRFEVHTQGRAWVIDKISKKKGATSLVRAESLVVFREQAAELFVKHPAIRWLGWKRLFGQYWSKDVYQDIVWNASDAFKCGRVLVVRKATFASIDDPKRLAEQIIKRRRILAGEFGGVLLILIMIILAALAFDILPPGVRDWLFALMPDVEQETSAALARFAFYLCLGGVILFGGAVSFMKIVRRPNPDGSVWDLEAELECAMAKADKARATEERVDSRKQ